MPTNYTNNLLNPGTTTGGVNATAAPNATTYIILRHLRIINKTGTAATFRLFLGATAANAAGTEIIGYDYSVAAASAFDWYGQLLLTTSDFLVGGSATNLALVIDGEGEVGIGS